MRVTVVSAARRAVVLLTAVLLTVVLVGCSGGSDDIVQSDDPRSGGQSGFDRPVATTVAPATAPGAGVPGAGVDATTPTAPVAVDPGDALLSAVVAFADALGSLSTPTLELVVQFPVGSAPYAFLKSQDPAQPTHVDERTWRDGVVGPPEPVRLTPADDLATELFALGDVNWPAIAAVLPTAPAAVEAQVGPLEGSSGVTHLIVSSGRPFVDYPVARVYVDGGSRHTGGYVQYRIDGTLDRVQA